MRSEENNGWGTVCRTAGHTRWSQLFWRLRRNLERRRKLGARSARWRWRAARAPRLSDNLPVTRGHGPAVREIVDGMARGVFRFLNQEQQLGGDKPDWRLGRVDTGRLWTITLHYHAWVFDLAREAVKGQAADGAAALFRHYVSDWIARCALDAPGARELAWNSYAVATRIAWWARAYRLLGPERWRNWGDFHEAFLASLWQQAAYLRDHLEWDLRANHLLRDAVGLAWAGRFFDEPEAREWLATATRLAVDQAAEQVLADGGHFERSPMYHLHVMEDFLSLALLAEDAEARRCFRDTWAAMAEFLAWMRHPDGDLALFNDGGLQGTEAVEHMLRLASAIGVDVSPSARRGGRHFPQTGLAVWHGQPWTVFFDVGPIGPDYQPGHAHADTLAVECSHRGARLFVGPGTYAYDLDERRRYDRSTAAHNTVGVDEQDSSEVWHIFRVGRRAYPRDVRVDCSERDFRASAWHTGYDHLPGRPRHTRRVEVGEGRLVLTDRVEGRGRHRLSGGLLLAPGWTAIAAGGGWVLVNGPRVVRLAVRGPEELRLYAERRPYHPEYGREVESTRLGWRLEGSLPAEVVTRAEGE